ncbi:MAG: heparinase II/III family protein [Candidatus Kapaibacterium sp.]
MLRLLLPFLLLATISALGQSGAWTPNYATATHPRILCGIQDTGAIRKNLRLGFLRTIFPNVYASALAAPPVDNNESNNRRERARLAKNAAFIYFIGMQPLADSVTTLEKATANSLQSKVIELLSTINTTIPALSIANPGNYDDWQWRSKDMIDYLSAYDLLKGAGVSDSALAPAKVLLQRYAGNLYREANRSFLGITFLSTVKNNHALMTCGALGVAAVVLNDATSTDLNEQPTRWINAALWNIDNILWRDAARQSDSVEIAGYAEGPYYLRYAMLNVIPFMRGMIQFTKDTTFEVEFAGEKRRIKNPRMDANYPKLWKWIYYIALPDGTLPPIGDTYVNTAFPEIDLLRSVYTPSLRPNSSGSNTLNNQLNSTVDMRANYIASFSALRAIIDERIFVHAFPESGDLTFRSSWDSANALYLHVSGAHGRARTSGAGHNQADVASFTMYQGGEALARDAGYLSYARRGEVGNASNHNMILVDGNGPAIGAPSQPNDADGFIENVAELPGLQYGEVRTNYLNTSITRSFLMVRGTYFLNADGVNSDSKHRYTWQLHGNSIASGLPGDTNFTLTSGTALWRGVHAKFSASITSPLTSSMKYTADSSVHELGYNSSSDHTRFLATTLPIEKATALTMLAPFEASANTRSWQSISTQLYTSLIFHDVVGGATDYAFTQADTIPIQTAFDKPINFADSVASDARFGYWSIDNASPYLPRSAFLREGTWMTSLSRTIHINVQPRMNVGYTRLTDTTLMGYGSKPGKIHLFVPFPVRMVSGSGVVEWRYEKDSAQVSITLDSASTFTIQLTKDPTSVVEVKESTIPSIRSMYPHPLTQGTLQVEYSGLRGSGELRLVNALGQVLAVMQVEKPSDSAHMQTENIPTGMYQVQLLESGMVVSQRGVVVLR